MKVVKTRRLFDAPDVGIKDIDGTCKATKWNVCKTPLSTDAKFNRTNQQPELLVAVKNLTLMMTSRLRHVRHSSKHESFSMQPLGRPRSVNPDRRPVLVTIGSQDWILVLKQYCCAI